MFKTVSRKFSVRQNENERARKFYNATICPSCPMQNSLEMYILFYYMMRKRGNGERKHKIVNTKGFAMYSKAEVCLLFQKSNADYSFCLC